MTKTEVAPKPNNSQRMINLGVKMYHKKLDREITVKELTLEAVIQCASELASLLTVIDFSQTDPQKLVLSILSEKSTTNALRMLAAQSTETTTEDWADCPFSTWVKFVTVATQVNDWEELKELFSATGLGEKFRSRIQASQAGDPGSPKVPGRRGK